MLTVADELWISGLPDEQRQIVERYVEAKLEDLLKEHDDDELQSTLAVNGAQLLATYQQGWRDGVAAGPSVELPSKLPALVRGAA